MDTLVILGASNVTLSLPVIWAGLQASESSPRRLLVAAGHGRSFALPNTVLGRTLPSILECELWETLAVRTESDAAVPTISTSGSVSTEAARPQALITDVGNDILYGASVTQIEHWLRECVVRLLNLGIRPRLTGLPLDSLRTLSRRRFLFFRSLLFPSSTLTFESAIEQAGQLDAALNELAAEFDLDVAAPRPHWYGLDPIHIRRRARPEAWRQYLAPLLTDFVPRGAGPFTLQKLWTQKAAVRWRGAREFVTPQPCLTTGSTELWLF
ncbi:hypothetical protein GC176_18735 [bacterium]|nr:hypothetical protein [bacterium]